MIYILTVNIFVIGIYKVFDRQFGLLYSDWIIQEDNYELLKKKGCFNDDGSID